MSPRFCALIGEWCRDVISWSASSECTPKHNWRKVIPKYLVGIFGPRWCGIVGSLRWDFTLIRFLQFLHSQLVATGEFFAGLQRCDAAFVCDAFRAAANYSREPRDSLQDAMVFKKTKTSSPFLAGSSRHLRGKAERRLLCVILFGARRLLLIFRRPGCLNWEQKAFPNCNAANGTRESRCAAKRNSQKH